jgi:hypothetical protein
MVAERGRVVAHLGHELELASGLAARGGESRAHAVVACVENEDRPAVLARILALCNERGEARVPAARLVVAEREGRVIGCRSHPDDGRVHVVGVKDGEGHLRPAAGNAPVNIVAPTAAESVVNLRREIGLPLRLKAVRLMKKQGRCAARDTILLFQQAFLLSIGRRGGPAVSTLSNQRSKARASSGLVRFGGDLAGMW